MSIRCARIALMLIVAGIVLGPPGGAQVVTGDIAAAGASAFQFTILDGTTYAPSTHSAGSWGDPSYLSSTILWDPNTQNDFLVAGNGFIGRATVGPAPLPGLLAAYSLVATGSWQQATQMSYGPGGEVVFLDNFADQVFAVDLTNGTSWMVTTGVQPWTAAGSASALFHPVTNEYYVGSGSELYRWTPAGGASLVATGLGMSVDTLAVDPFSTDIIVGAVGSDEVFRVAQSGSVTSLVPAGAVRPSSISVDQNGDFVVGGIASGTFGVHRIPNAGGSVQTLTTMTPPTCCEVSVVGGLGYANTMLPPSLAVSTGVGGDVTLSLSTLPTWAFAGLTILTTTTPTPIAGGPIFGVTPDALSFTLAGLSPFPGVGNPFHFLTGFPGAYPDVPFAFPPGTGGLLAGVTLDFTAAVYDTTVSTVSASNVVRLTF